MSICDEERHTSQGTTYCHQPAEHRPHDHIAYLEDKDGDLWLVSWNGRNTELRQLPKGK